jgi:uncharacterized membrane protein YphA (DoxX/SURF4 family)
MLTPKNLWLRGRQGDHSAWFVLSIRIFAAAIWFVFGIIFKVLDVIPRHREIVAVILGNESATLVTTLIGSGEVIIGIWFLSGILARSCAVAQTITIATMNALELIYARPLLLAPVPMIILNAVFLVLVWYAACWTPAEQT